MSLSDKLREAWAAIEDGVQIDKVDDYFADGYVRHSDEGSVDRDGFKEILSELHTAFPDLTFELLDVVEQGDRVAYRWESVGTHERPYLGAPATRKTITARGIAISRFDSAGKIVEDWASWNKVSVLHSLGIIPVG